MYITSRTKTFLGLRNSMSLLITFLLLLFCSLELSAQGEYITKWNVTSTRNNAARALLQAYNGVTYNFTVDWGDGTVETNQTSTIDHTYATTGEYTVTISGTFPGMRCGSCSALEEVVQWGATPLASFQDAFKRSRLTKLPSTPPDLSGVTDMSAAFEDCTVFNQDISNWDVSGVTIFNSLFEDAYEFNQPLNSWNVSSAQSMTSMFKEARVFDQDLSSWNTANVTSMASMFERARVFNGNISTWNTSNVTDMSSMFEITQEFNIDISAWDVSKVTTMNSMFKSARAFNQPLNTWNTQSVTDLSDIFASSTFNQDLNNWKTSLVTNLDRAFSILEFNGDVSTWDVSNVTSMEGTFRSAKSFKGDLSSWNVGKVTNMKDMFNAADSLNSDISSWDVSKVTNMEGMFTGALLFNQNISSWDVSSVTNMSKMFQRSKSFNQPIGTWDVSKVTDMSTMFQGTTVFNQNISTWDVSSVTNMSSMFASAEAYNQPLNTWDVSKVESMSNMFTNANSFNQPLNNWTTSSLTSIRSIFSSNTAFSQDLNNWDVSKVTDFSGAFSNASKFNGNISAWNVSSGQNMSSMFSNDSLFNQDISSWNTANVTTMAGMFRSAVAFNQNISSWDVSKVEFFSSMFNGALAFNQPLNSWTFTAAKNMTSMFENAEAFNQPLNSWDVSAIENLRLMFKGAKAFDQDLSSWRFNGLNRGGIPGFDNSGLSQENYDKFIIAMSENPPNLTRQTMFAEGLIYCSSTEARQSLIDNQNWTFRGDRQCGVFLESATLDSDTQITLTFSSSLKIETQGAASDFVVKDALDSAFLVSDYQDGTAGDNKLILTVASLANAVSDITITYNKTTSDIKNLDGSLPLRTDETGVVIEDVILPTIVAAEKSTNTSVSVKFSEPITAFSFSLDSLVIKDAANDTFAVSRIIDRVRNDQFVELTVEDLSTATGDLTLTYKKPQTSIFNDLGGNALATDLVGVVLGSAPVATTLSISGPTIVGQTLTANYTYNDNDGDAESGTTFQWYTGLALQEAVIHRGVTLTSQVNNGSNGDDNKAFYDILNNLSFSDNEVVNATASVEDTVVLAFAKLPEDGGSIFIPIQSYSSSIESLDGWTRRNNLRLASTTLTSSDLTGISTEQDIDKIIKDNNIRIQGTNEINLTEGAVVAFQFFSPGLRAEQGLLEVTSLSGTSVTFNAYIGLTVDERSQAAVPINGATSSTYTLTDNELGKLVFFDVTPANTVGVGATTRSDAVGPVINGSVVSFASSNALNPESTTAVSVQVNLTTTLSDDVSVNYAVSGTATSGGVDHTLVDGALSFTAGETSKTIDFDVIDESLIEDDETVIITLTSTSSEALVLGSNSAFTYTIENDDFNNAPTDIALDNSSLAENNALDATIGSLTTTDADAGDTHTYSLVTGTGDTDNASFILAGSTLKTNNVTFNFEDKSSYSIRLQTDDGNGGVYQEAFTINVSDVNEAPFALSLSNTTISESDNAQEVGNLSSLDPDASETTTYALVAGDGDANNDEFTVSGAVLSTAGAINFEDGASRTIRLSVTDKGGLSFEENFTIAIEDVVQEPLRPFTQNEVGADVKNVFTPNGDGTNDTWVIDDILDNPVNVVKVFAQGGKLVYSKENYQNDWDGTFEGDPVPPGTYYYEINIYNGQRIIRGFLTIIRN